MVSINKVNLNALNMDILIFSHAVLTPRWNAKNIRSTFTRIYMITKGEAFLFLDKDKIKMVPGTVYVIPAGLNFSYSCEKSCEKYFFHISLTLPSEYDIFYNIKKIFVFEDPEGIKGIEESHKADTIRKFINIKTYLYNLILKCLDQCEEIEINKYSDTVLEIIEYITKNLSSSLSVNEISDALYVSTAKIRKIFKKETGIPIGKYIDDRVMIAAEEKIRNSKLSIKEISDSLNFCDQFYFSRCFREKYGRSPVKYRKEFQYIN